jgi:hypothetical protein
MAMRDDAWYPGDAERDTAADAQEARILDLLRRALTSDAPAEKEPRQPGVTLATYLRMFDAMTERADFTRGALVVPARFAPQVMMRIATRDETLRVTGQRTRHAPQHPPSVRITCARISLPPPTA